MKLIAWDFDGVLNRGYQGGFDQWQSSFEHDLGIPAEPFTTFMFQAPRFAEVLTGARSILALLADYITLHDIPHSPQTLLDYWIAKDANADAQVIAWLRDCPIPGVIATNNETHRAEHMWSKMGLQAHMQHIFASGRMGVRKPDPAFFAQIEQWSGHAPADILLIDDAAKNITAAALRGWQVFHFTDETREKLPQVLGLTP